MATPRIVSGQKSIAAFLSSTDAFLISSKIDAHHALKRLRGARPKEHLIHP
jgi:hypothetical protein